MSILRKNKDSILQSSDTLENEFRITNFEGPLDLLLKMLKQSKLEIKDVFLSEVTDQYLEYMKDLSELELEQASEFVEVAAYLIEVKSKSLLPQLEEEVAAVDNEEQSKDELIRRLEEYKLYKEASEKLHENEQVGLCFREPDASVGEPRLVLKDMTSDGLLKAIQKLFLKLEKRVDQHVARKIVLDPYTVAEKIDYIRERVKTSDQTYFEELFGEDYTKNEVITTFQALLELLKMQEVGVKQEAVFDPILIYKVEQI